MPTVAFKVNLPTLQCSNLQPFYLSLAMHLPLSVQERITIPLALRVNVRRIAIIGVNLSANVLKSRVILRADL